MVQNNTLNDSVLYNSVPHVHYLCQPPLESRNPAFHLQPKLVCEALSPQLFWYVKAKLQKSRFLHSFVILSWRGCYTKRGKKRKRFQLCLLPALRLLCTSRLHLLAMLALYCSALTRSRMERSHCSRENKRLWSALQRPSLTPRPSPFRQLYATGKTNIEFFFLPAAVNTPTTTAKLHFFSREKDKEKKHISTSILLPKTHWTPF